MCQKRDTPCVWPQEAPRALALAHLDQTGCLYMEHYQWYCRFICIGPDLLNYFVKTFLKLAGEDEAIAYALSAWGGFMLERRRGEVASTDPWRYMQKAAQLMYTRLGSEMRARDRREFFSLFAFYLIFIAIEVWTGDVENWPGLFRLCAGLIKSAGGLQAVCGWFGGSNDIRWLLSNFQFHDLLSLRALTAGTEFDVESYLRVLSADAVYGVDPLQGALGPVYNLMGEIGNAAVRLRAQWRSLATRLAADDAVTERTAHYEDVAAHMQYFDNELLQCVPDAAQLALLGAEKQRLQKELFALYVVVARMELNTAVGRVAASAAVQQGLLVRALLQIDVLLESPVRVLLLLALLVCGLASVHECDRSGVRRRLQRLLRGYEIGSLQRIRELIEEAWRTNALAQWGVFLHAKGWALYVG